MDTLKKVMSFCNNIKKKKNINALGHNIYILQTRDQNDNVVSEAYAANLLTTNGFRRYYDSTNYGKNTNTKNLYIGTGTTAPTIADTTIETPVTSTAATELTTTVSSYPIIYDTTTDLVIGYTDWLDRYFNYNISGVTSSVNITEIGIGETISSLYTRSQIYDADGNVSYIKKDINQKLYIHCLWGQSYKSKMISDAYDNGIYMIIDPKWDQSGYYYGYGDVLSQTLSSSYSSYLHNRSATSFSDNVISDTVTLGTKLIENTTSIINDIVFMYHDWSPALPRCVIYKPISLSSPEELTSTDFYLNRIDQLMVTKRSNDEIGRFDSAMCLGDRNYYIRNRAFSVSQFTMSSLSMYNHLTQEWDISETYSDNTGLIDYDNNSFLNDYGVNIQVSIDGVNHLCRVFVNHNTSVPILLISNNGTYSVYATDKYWDASTYETIIDVNNIDATLQKKRYYIIKDINANTNYANAKLYALRKDNYAKILNLSDQVYDMPTHSIPGIFSTQLSDDYVRPLEIKTLSSDNYNWICFAGNVVYPLSTDKNVYSLSDVSTGGSYPNYPNRLNRWNIDDMILFMKSDMRNMKVVDISNDPTIAPIEATLTLNWTNYNENSEKWPRCSFSNIGTTNGYLAIQLMNSMESIVLTCHDVNNDNGISQLHFDNTNHMAVMTLTDDVIYQNTSDTSTTTVEIFNMTSRTVAQTFVIPSGFTINNIIGWKDYAYIYVQKTDDSTFHTYFYNSTTQVLTYLPDMDLSYNMSCQKTGVYGSGGYKMPINVFNDEIFIPLTNVYPTYMYAFLYENPTEPIQLSSTPIVAKAASIKYMNNNKQLYLSLTCALQSESGWYANSGATSHCLYDLGLFIDTYKSSKTVSPISLGNVTYVQSVASGYANCLNSIGDMCLFKDGFVLNHSSFSNKAYYQSLARVSAWFPLACGAVHKAIGTTTTIQAHNNPKNIDFKNITLNISNVIPK